MIFWWVTLNCTSDNTDQIIQIFNLENEQEIAIVMKIDLKTHLHSSFVLDEKFYNNEHGIDSYERTVK